MTSIETIKKFMKKLGMKIYLVPHYYDKDRICVQFKVYYGEKVSYWSENCFTVDQNGKVQPNFEEIYFRVEEGVFSFLGDKDSIDDFFYDITKRYASKVY